MLTARWLKNTNRKPDIIRATCPEADLMTLTTKILSILLFAFALSACGQSGPLTLPDETSATDVQSEDDPQDDEQEEDEQD